MRLTSCLVSALLVLVHALAAGAAPNPSEGARVAPDGSLGLGTVKVRADSSGITRAVLDLPSPPVASLAYAIVGTVQTTDVRGPGYLEMWSHFPDGGRYFSRTLAPSGPMAMLEGTSGPRPFALPFQLTAEAPRPERLIVNVVLPGAGEVVLRDLRFTQSGAAAGAWWSDALAGLLGGVLGAGVGLAGALAGTLCGMGVARRLVIALLYGMIALGLAGLALGGVALALGQPYAVYYPLLLLGGICTAIGPLGLRTARMRYAARAFHAEGAPEGA
jgi:hypothetical protein